MPELTLKAIEQLLDKRLDPINRGLATIDKRLDAVEKKLSAVESTMATKDDLVSEIRSAKAQISRLEFKLDRISERTAEDEAAVVKNVLRLTRRVRTLETEVARLKLQRAA